MRILILGGAGFVGANLVRHCLQHPGNKITVVDALIPRLHSTREFLEDVWPQIEFIQADIRDADAMRTIIKDKDVIYNCAAQTSHPYSLQDPILDTEINCMGNLTLLEAVRQHNKDATVVYTSCSTVVGRMEGQIIDETHIERPLDIYSANKSAVEKYYYIYHIVHELKTIVLRFANLYGPYGKGLPEFGFINYFIHLAEQGENITVYGTGHQMRNVMYVEDATDIIYQSAFNSNLIGKILFAAHHEHYSVFDIARTIVDVFNRGQVVNVPWPDVRKRIEIDDVEISSAQLLALTKWRPRYSLREGLTQVKKLGERVNV